MTEQDQPIPVRIGVIEGIEAVRKSGLTNMYDGQRVAELAADLGFDLASEWVAENPVLYARALIHGLTVQP